MTLAAPDKHPVFLKTFSSLSDRPIRQSRSSVNKNIKKELQALLDGASVPALRLPAHGNVVGGTRLCYGTVSVPKTGRTGNLFFTVSPDLCMAGELFE